MEVQAGFTILLTVFLDLGVCLRPNIVIIIADDLGWNDVGFHSGDAETPNIDALAYHGVIFNRHYALPVCSPSRTALMTGDYPLRHGMQAAPCSAGSHDGLPLNVKIMPEYFSNLGYKSHLVGKWHLGYESKGHLPTSRGFDSFFGYLNGFLGYWDYVHYSKGIRAGRDIRRNEEGVWGECYGHYLTDVLTKEAVRVISQHPGQGGLFLVLSHAAVHSTPLGPMREAPPRVSNTTNRGFLRATAERMDLSVGVVTRALHQRGLLNNSIIVFLSDNGAPTNTAQYTNYGSNWPLRGEKGSLHDGGVRTVAAIWSPLIEKKSRVSNQYFHISDWLPTLYAAAGGQPEDLENQDGIDQWTSLLSSTPGERDTILVNINDLHKTEAVIKNKWKLVKSNSKQMRINVDAFYGENGRWMRYDAKKLNTSIVAQILGPVPKNYLELRRSASVDEGCTDKAAAIAEDCRTGYCLFDILNDPTECYNLASNNSRIVANLKAIIDSYRPSLVPTPPKNFDSRASPKNWNDYWSPWMD